jgi:hypothetical protein
VDALRFEVLEMRQTLMGRSFQGEGGAHATTSG